MKCLKDQCCMNCLHRIRNEEEIMKMISPIQYFNYLKTILDNYVIKRDKECWEWTGSRSSGNYGTVTAFDIMKSQRRSHQAHRLSLIAYSHTFPAGKWILACHKCDNPPCTNPDHLFWGTHEDNMNEQLIELTPEINTALNKTFFVEFYEIEDMMPPMDVPLIVRFKSNELFHAKWTIKHTPDGRFAGVGGINLIEIIWEYVDGVERDEPLYWISEEEFKKNLLNNLNENIKTGRDLELKCTLSIAEIPEI